MIVLKASGAFTLPEGNAKLFFDGGIALLLLLWFGLGPALFFVAKKIADGLQRTTKTSERRDVYADGHSQDTLQQVIVKGRLVEATFMESSMVTLPHILHHIRGRLVETRLCDFEPATDRDIPVEDIFTIRDARAEATLCPKCQQRSPIADIHLRQDRYGSGKRSQARMFTVPVLYRFDDIRNCLKCRIDPDDHSCQHWEEARKAVRVLKQQAKLFVKDVNELVEATGGRGAMLYRFLDGSVAFFAWGAPSWQEAGENHRRRARNCAPCPRGPWSTGREARLARGSVSV